ESKTLPFKDHFKTSTFRREKYCIKIALELKFTSEGPECKHRDFKWMEKIIMAIFQHFEIEKKESLFSLSKRSRKRIKKPNLCEIKNISPTCCIFTFSMATIILLTSLHFLPKISKKHQLGSQ
ncbi:hypothetical protein ERO13_D03G071401v2, partial [Gossypium hirsutum]